MPRREFSKAVKIEIIKRATPAGTRAPPWCEKCSAMAARFEIHHLVMDALEIDKKRKLVAADGQLLCKPCHDEITKAQTPVLNKAKRREAKHLGVKDKKPQIPRRPPAPRVTTKLDSIRALPRRFA
jgi:hypothetical protein